MLDEILSGCVLVAKSNGAKNIRLPKRPKLVLEKKKELTAEEVIRQLKTPGTIVKGLNE